MQLHHRNVTRWNLKAVQTTYEQATVKFSRLCKSVISRQPVSLSRPSFMTFSGCKDDLSLLTVYSDSLNKQSQIFSQPKIT